MNREEYARYLRSKHWQKVRRAALKRAGYRCQICNRAKSLQIHHRSYENLGHERASDVVCLCDGCHALFHKAGKIG